MKKSPSKSNTSQEADRSPASDQLHNTQLDFWRSHFAEQGITSSFSIATGAPDTCPDCGTKLELNVHESRAGFYLGTWCRCGPYSRETDYYRTREDAEQALKSNDWIARQED